MNQIEELNRAIQEKEGPFLIHCARAALLLVLSKAKKNNWTAERIFEECPHYGFRFTELAGVFKVRYQDGSKMTCNK